MCLTNQAFLSTVADMENSETLKGLLTIDGKDPEQSMQEISVWLMQKGRCDLGLLKPHSPPKKCRCRG